MRPVRFTKSLTAASVNKIAQSQTPGAAGNLTLNGSSVTGGVAILDSPRQVLFTFAADESAKTLTITGNQRIDGTGNTITETITPPAGAGTATSVQMFGQVSKVAVSAALTGAVQVGTNGVGASQWVQADYHLDPTNLTIAVSVTGTVNYTVQYTYDDIVGANDPQGGTFSFTPPSRVFNDPVAAAVTTSQEVAVDNPINAWRVQINSDTGSLSVEAIQAGVGGLGS